MKDQFNYFLPLSKVEKNDDGTRTVTGYASTPALDLDGEIITLNAVKSALPSYMEWRNIRQMHQAIAVGTAKEAVIDDKGLYLTARIVDANAIKLLDEEVLKGFSIGGKKLAKTGNTITQLELIEISLVDRPANPECRIDSVKAAMKDITMFGDLSKDAGAETTDEVGYLRTLVNKLLGTSAPAAEHTFTIKAYDEGNFIELMKRKFSDKERSDAADSGEAMPDGSFPIKNEQDLKNAIQASGRAKDPAKAKAHIKARAKALGHADKIPDDWQDKNEVDKAAQAVMEANPELFGAFDVTESIVLPQELTAKVVGAMKGGAAIGKRAEGVTDRIAKGCHVLADLVYAFGILRDAQRRLLVEGAIEKDGDDEALSKELGQIAHDLAMVMGRKAEHEGSEALFLTDADDLRFITYNGDVAMTLTADTTDLAKRASKAQAKALQHLQKAGKAHAEGMKCLNKCGAMMGKAANSGEVIKAADLMTNLTKAHEAFGESADHMEMAHAQMAKGAGGQVWDGGEAGANAATGVVKPLSQSTMTEGDVPWYDADKPYPGKQASAGMFTQEQVDALTKAAGAEATSKALAAENERLTGLLKAAPLNPRGNGPRLFAVDKTTILSNGAEQATKDELLYDGVDVARINNGDSDYSIKAAGEMINNMVHNKDKFAKSVFDPEFRGKAGLRN